MRRILPLTAVALMLTTAPALAQSAPDTTTTTTTTSDTTTTTDTATSDTATSEPSGNFSRNIPQGLATNLSEDEIGDFQARLDAAETPQERNAVRQELQRLSQQRHLDSVQAQKKQPKGFFDSLTSDFNDVISGKAIKDAQAREKTREKAGGKETASNDKDRGGKDRGGNDRGGKDRSGSDRGGKDRGGKDNGGGRG